VKWAQQPSHHPGPRTCTALSCAELRALRSRMVRLAAGQQMRCTPCAVSCWLQSNASHSRCACTSSINVAIGCACSACFSADHIKSGSTLCVIHTRCNDGSHTQRSMTSPLLTLQLVTMVQLRSTSHHRHSPLAARRRGRITLAMGEMTCVLQGATSTRHIYEHLRSHTAPKVWMSYLCMVLQLQLSTG
jgi:hypothetical protein